MVDVITGKTKHQKATENPTGQPAPPTTGQPAPPPTGQPAAIPPDVHTVDHPNDEEAYDEGAGDELDNPGGRSRGIRQRR